ncbi:glycerate kinase [Elusimicrobium posterum]|uniref:glycerate kinase family protein n=1 Tax=Elusimicrobium posterum TaxID=3116653 RepID=UPI003C786279
MKVLILSNALKGSLDAYSTGSIIARTLKKAGVKAEFLPVSDGGDGIIQAIQKSDPKSTIFKTTVGDAYNRAHSAPILILKDKKTCVIETAKICGLGVLKKEDLKPLNSTSYGVGQAIKYAASKGVKNFYIGLGGVGCNDGGAGMANALGIKFFDKKGKEIPNTTKALLKLQTIDAKSSNLKGLKFFALTDVENPILGPKGSAKVFGPQKGATPAQVKVMDKALTDYVKVIKNDLGKDIARVKGTGAAGAIAAGLLAFCNAKFINGAPFVLKQLRAEEKIKNADLIITTEGRLDHQTFMGKIPSYVLKTAKKYKRPTIFICGENAIKNKKTLAAHGITEVREIISVAKNKEDAIKNAAKLLPKLCKI